MDFELTHEQEMLLATVRRFMAEEIYPHEEEVDRQGQVPLELSRSAAAASITRAWRS